MRALNVRQCDLAFTDVTMIGHAPCGILRLVPSEGYVAKGVMSWSVAVSKDAPSVPIVEEHDVIMAMTARVRGVASHRIDRFCKTLLVVGSKAKAATSSSVHRRLGKERQYYN